MDIDLKRLRSLMRALEEFDIAELELEDSDLRVVIRRRLAPEVALQAAPQPAASLVPPPAATTPPAAPAAPAEAGASETGAAEDPDVAYVTSPFVGTFYRAPAPGAKPFVDVGQDVEAGQTLCIVEAMKLMNEIEAEFPCTILEVLVDNGKPVEYGDRLFKVRRRG